jgi:DNA modification methylase
MVAVRSVTQRPLAVTPPTHDLAMTRRNVASDAMTDETASARRRRRPTATSAFGVGRRENHDASEFYARFPHPEISDDASVYDGKVEVGDGCLVGDSRAMDVLPDNCVALVVTSPPYFVGKEYEEAVGRGEIPASYEQYLDMLHDVFAECRRVLEPGGRIAVNVANLGRKPYRSLSADVIAILESLGLLLRGEIIWRKGRGTSSSCAWGSYRQATNPVLRDTSERVIVASKGRFDRAIGTAARRERRLPHESTLTADEFMEATLDIWEIDAESARRVKHPAPFPVDLPRRLIDLYTYRNDLVLDPFLGSGTTVVAAKLTGRRGVGFDLDPEYADIARARLAATEPERSTEAAIAEPPRRQRGRRGEAAPDVPNFPSRSRVEGKKAQDIAEQLLKDAQFEIVGRDVKLPVGVQFNFEVNGESGQFYVDVSGAFTTVRPGLQRTDTLWKTLGRAAVLNSAPVQDHKLLILTSNLPRPGSEGDKALRAAGGRNSFFDAIEMFDDLGFARLHMYATCHVDAPLDGFWSDTEIRRKWG